MSIGQMRERVSIERATNASDGAGGYTVTWSNVATVWARVKPKSGGEVLEQQQIQSRATYEITIRHRTDIAETMRAIWNGITLNIRDVQNLDEHKRFLVLQCEQGVNT